MSAGSRWALRARRWSRPASWRAALWAWRSCRATRGLTVEDLGRAPLLPVPPAGCRDRGPVDVVLRRTGATCVPRSLVLQAWETAHDRPIDVVVGVRREDGRVVAHAWMEGDPREEGNGFVEITRRPSRVLDRA